MCVSLTISELAVVLELLISCSTSEMSPCDASSPSNGAGGLPSAGISPRIRSACARDLRSEKKLQKTMNSICKNDLLIVLLMVMSYLWCLYKLLLVLKAKPHGLHGYGRSLVCARICLRNTDGFVQFNWQNGHTCLPGVGALLASDRLLAAVVVVAADFVGRLLCCNRCMSSVELLELINIG